MTVLRWLCLIVVCSIAFIVTDHACWAQGNEDRGYGGPLTVGPNFKQGGQHAPPDYNSAPKKKTVSPSSPVKKPAAIAKPKKSRPETNDVATTRQKSRQNKPADETAKASPEATTNTSTTATSAGSTDQTSGATAVDAGSSDAATSEPASSTCRKFDATTNTTIEVACP